MNSKLAFLLIVILLGTIACSDAYNNHKKIVKYQIVNNLQEDQSLFPVRKDGGYGYINKEGNLVIAPKLKIAGNFTGNLAYVSTDDGAGFINKKGEVIISNYDLKGYPYDHYTEEMIPITGYYFSLFNYKRYGFMDSNGKVAIEPQFDDVNVFSEGLAGVAINGKWGFINKEGKIVIKPQFSWVKEFSEGLAAVQIDGKWSYIDREGKVIFSVEANEVNNFKEGLARINKFDPIKSRWVCSFIDKTGKQVIDSKFAECSDFSEGLAPVKPLEASYSKYIDKTGQEVISVGFLQAFGFSDGLARVVTESSKTAYIDKTGKIVIDNIDLGQDFKNGLAAFSDNQGDGYINKEGKVVWRSSWQPIP